MAQSTQSEEDEITGINVTPLVDVMLVLLIIFMVTANYMVSKSIQVKLPKADTGEEMQAETKNLGFIIDETGKLFLEGKELTFEDVSKSIALSREEIKKAVAEGKAEPKLQALITADVKTPHGDVVKLIDIVRKNGITEFAINVETATEATTKPETTPQDAELKP